MPPLHFFSLLNFVFRNVFGTFWKSALCHVTERNTFLWSVLASETSRGHFIVSEALIYELAGSENSTFCRSL